MSERITSNGEALQAAMQALDEGFNGHKPEGATDASWREIGLVLFQFPYGDQNGRANYVSNGADRADMIKFLRSTADRFERQLAAEASETRDQINEADIKGMIFDQIDRTGVEEPKQVIVDAVSKRLADEGKLVEAGWHAFRRMFMKPTAPPHRVKETRLAFLAGADHLFSSMMQIMDKQSEPTEDDMRRMDLISNEMLAFQKETYGK